MSWLSSLPHQIPFRAAAAVIRRDQSSIDGVFLWTANETLPAEVMLVEAMAQFAGGLVFDPTGHGFVSGIDGCQISRPVEPGDRVNVHVTLEASFGAIFRFQATADVDGVEMAWARFYLSSEAASA
jgi:3-hydroxymyristoyl/3-hydroxydecanoyl-(acyl carrier protein) dehydratase